MGELRSWILGLTAAGVISAAANAFGKQSGAGKVLRFACGLLMLSALLGPFGELDWESYALALRDNRALSEELTATLVEQNKSMERLYIERECEAYILDEAEQLGMEGEVEVRAKWKENAFLPWEVTLKLSESDAQKVLSARIEAELGIPKERQVWQ